MMSTKTCGKIGAEYAKTVGKSGMQLKLVLMISQKSAGTRPTLLWMIFH